MSQNIFDNEIFFNEYIKLREGINYNDLLEQPAMKKLLPDMKDKKILDIGCGYGKNSYDFIQRGAKKVVGIDISTKMLEMAKKNFFHKDISYLNLNMEELEKLEETFDIVYSSLVFHYIKDFKKVISDIYKLLNKEGVLLFSQEHPFVTSTVDCKGHYEVKENKKFYYFSDYSKSGKRVGEWFVDGVENYHRSFSEIINTLIQVGFKIVEIVEPLPSKEALEIKPDLEKEFIKPTFLIIKVKK